MSLPLTSQMGNLRCAGGTHVVEAHSDTFLAGPQSLAPNPIFESQDARTLSTVCSLVALFSLESLGAPVTQNIRGASVKGDTIHPIYTWLVAHRAVYPK